ncbi:MAG: domain, FtsQ-type [Candidatus Eremiobacteraeota bacterium]|nr:domain, FtsQ-type [Candidatus Eremiobacteraeota bacterium]
MKAGARPRVLPRRRKPSLAARVRPFWILAVLAAALLIWGGVWLAQSPWFRIARIGIDVPLGSPVSRGEVRSAAAVPSGANVWLLNPWAIAHRIEAIPYVETATVHRGQFPQPFLEIGATTRRPTGCVRAGARVVTIDATARVLQNGCAVATAALIDAGKVGLAEPGGRLANADITRLLDDAKILADASLALRTLGRDRWGGLEAVDVTGVTLRFGEDADLAKKAALVGPVRAGVGSRRPIRAVDLRAPSTPTVEFR